MKGSDRRSGGPKRFASAGSLKQIGRDHQLSTPGQPKEKRFYLTNHEKAKVAEAVLRHTGEVYLGDVKPKEPKE